MPPRKQHQEPSGPVTRRLTLAWLVVSALALSCASTAPPLAPNLEALVDESRNLEGLLNRYASTEGKFRDDVSATSFKSWFKPPELLIVRAVTKGFDGNNRETHAYYRDNKPFYGIEWTQIQFQERTALQVFLDPSGAVIGSRSEGNGHLVPMPAGQPDALVARIRGLQRDAERTRGPGQKIKFDLGSLNELGLQGPPLRAIRYVYCIPALDSDAETVQGIDPSAQVDRDSGSPCMTDQWRVTGSTHQAGYADILKRLAKLDFVDQITEVQAAKPAPASEAS